MSKRSLAFTDPEEAPVPRSQTAAMSLALQLASRAGLTWVKYGEVSPAKVLQMVYNLMNRHHVHLPSQAQSYRRAAGLPVARLILAPYPEEITNYVDQKKRLVWPYLLLASKDLPGEKMARLRPSTAAKNGGRFPHARADKSHNGRSILAYTWRGRYVWGVRPRTFGKRAQNPYVLTWFLTDWEFDRWSTSLALAARRGDTRALAAAFGYLAEYPRFGGVREDLRRLIKLARKAFEPHRRRADGRRLAFPLPEELRKLPPLRAVKIWDDPPMTLGESLKALG